MRLSMFVFLHYKGPPGYSVAFARLNHHWPRADEGDEVAVSELVEPAVHRVLDERLQTGCNSSMKNHMEDLLYHLKSPTIFSSHRDGEAFSNDQGPLA